MFGELIGLWLAQVWMDQGAPGDAILLETGPGPRHADGRCAARDRGVPGFHAAMRLHLVEASPHLREVQQPLAPHAPTFHDTLDTVPERPVFAIANEFFDALPIRQFQRAKGDFWHERVVGLRATERSPSASRPGAARRARAPPRRYGTGHDRRDLRPGRGDRGRARPPHRTHGGAAILIDYGEEESIGDTFQAVAGHAPVGPFADPGKADLTAHVAFGPLARAARPARASALVPQGVFLERLGITARAQALAKGLRGPALDRHIAAHRRLTHPDEMGHLFKVRALFPDGMATPPGFDA
jgi:NADH dehydrogenase [ubiquinone] 1 alpha subcomplex assembly factor 7